MIEEEIHRETHTQKKKEGRRKGSVRNSFLSFFFF
jgi:hypothetical protein